MQAPQTRPILASFELDGPSFGSVGRDRGLGETSEDRTAQASFPAAADFAYEYCPDSRLKNPSYAGSVFGRALNVCVCPNRFACLLCLERHFHISVYSSRQRVQVAIVERGCNKVS